MSKGHVFIATSLDGFIARPDHEIDWLMKQPDPEGDHGYEALMSRVGGLVMGRRSFEKVLSFGVDWPYSKPVVVLSRTLQSEDIPVNLRDRVEIQNGGPTEIVQMLAERGWPGIYVDGGQVVQSFLREGLIVELTITVIPVLIGEGIRLFGRLDKDIDLELLEARSFSNGMAQLRYRVPGAES